MKKIRNGQHLSTLKVGTKFIWHGRRMIIKQNDTNGISAEYVRPKCDDGLEVICFNNDHIVEVIP